MSLFTPNEQDKVLSNREYLGITIPFMISTMTQPLMGAVNTAVMGQLPDPKYIAAVSLGAMLFNNLYWVFGFLRVSTTGYSAQAHGAGDKVLGMLAFFKPFVLAMVVSVLCIIFQKPIVDAYLGMIGAAPEVDELTRVYYKILVWGAPMVLGNYVGLGWLMGQTMIRASVFLQMSMNVMNMLLSIAFVFWMQWGVEGVAWATLLSQIYGGVMTAILMYAYGKFNLSQLPTKELVDIRTFIDMLKVNVNLMIRTACLLTVNNILTAVGASFGTAVLAANAVLFQIKDIMSYLIDGMANGASIFSGRAIGKHSKELFNATISMTYKWMIVLVVFLMACFHFGNRLVIKIFTNIDSVIQLALQYNIYILVWPVFGCIGMVLYGVFCGATRTAPVRNMMLISLTVFYAAEKLLVPLKGNDGLWMAYQCFFISQAIVLSYYLTKLKKELGF
ncbi:MAG: MATE family efflux transporter [Phascolarctobacterium sp.]|nr:MATE family efflux transporter [Phascolarctobacterium sp.]